MANKLVSSFNKPVPQRKPRVTLTENGALTNSSTSNAVLDFFSKSGALRGSALEFVKMFRDAYTEDPQLAVRALFQARDIRGGNGERKNFREAFRWLSNNTSSAWKKLICFVPEYGRWDDLFEFLTPEIEDFICKQFWADLRAFDSGQPISLLAKWMPSENASSHESKVMAQHFAEILDLTPREYRKALSSLRNRIKIVETQMSQNEWREIDYERVPSQASRIYRNAFKRHDQERYTSYVEAAKRGEKKINAATITPVQLVREAWHKEDATIEAQWLQLPNYMTDGSLIAVADTSGSMSGAPLETAVSLAIYAAEKSKGPFKGNWMNFSTKPKWQTLKGKTLHEKVCGIDTHDWEMSTNLEAVFNLILKTAVANDVSEEDMPKIVCIISDMQFDVGTGRQSFTTHEAIKSNFRAHGYEMPVLVYWNVRASNGQPVTKSDTGTILVSGESASAFKAIMSCDLEKLQGATPLSHMLDILNGERYAQITL